MMGFQKAMFKYRRVPVFVSQSKLLYVDGISETSTCSLSLILWLLVMSWERAVMGGNGDDGCSGQSAITQPTNIYTSFILLLYNLEINKCPYPAVKTSFPSSISGVYSGDIPNPYKVTCTNPEAASPPCPCPSYSCLSPKTVVSKHILVDH